MQHWFTRTLAGCCPADEDCAKALEHYAIGSTFPMDLATRKTRSGQWHRKYWVLMSMLADNLESVEVELGMRLSIHSKDDAHAAMKYATGLYDSYVIKGGIVRILRSTAFDAMTQDEWQIYWAKVLDAVHQKFLPSIEIASVEEEIARCAS